MPRSVLIPRKTLILKNDEISKIQALLNDAYQESGLVNADKTKADSEEFRGGDREVRSGLLIPLIILYEKISGKDAGAHTRELPQYRYELEAPAYKLQEAYLNYINCVFYGYVDSKNAEKRDEKTLESVVDNQYVYLREILLRLFTAAISIDKNNSASAQEAKKIIACLSLFLKKINQTSVMYDKPKGLFQSSIVSGINIAFAHEHKEWVYLLTQMQEIMENMHKHTASISKLIALLSGAKTIIAQQLVAYISRGDIPKEKLFPAWIKYTLFEQELILLGQKNIIQSEFYTLSDENYRSQGISTHQKKLIKISQNKKIEELYNLLARTNILLAILDQIDILLSTTGWVLIMTKVLNLQALSKLISDYGQDAAKMLKFNIRAPYLKGKEEIKKSLIANDALTGIDFQQNLNIAIDGINHIESGIIRGCINDIITTAVNDLESLQSSLNCKLIDSSGAQIFRQKNQTTAHIESSNFSMMSGRNASLLNSSSNSSAITISRLGVFTKLNTFMKSELDRTDPQKIKTEFPKVTLVDWFNNLVHTYKTEHKWYNSTSEDTEKLFENFKKAKNDEERRQLICTYLDVQKDGRFCKILIAAKENNSLFNNSEQTDGDMDNKKSQNANLIAHTESTTLTDFESPQNEAQNLEESSAYTSSVFHNPNLNSTFDDSEFVKDLEQIFQGDQTEFNQ